MMIRMGVVRPDRWSVAMRRAWLVFALVTCHAVELRALDPRDDPSDRVRALRDERAQRTRTAQPADYARIDADLAAQAAADVAAVDPQRIDPAYARAWASLYTLAERHEVARELLRGYLARDLAPEDRYQGEMDLMHSAVKLNDGETVFQTLMSMRIDPAHAVNLGSYFGGTFHHFVFNARGASGCLKVLARIEPMIPGGPFANDEVRKSNGWARRQLAAAKALYLAESGRKQEAVEVLDAALAQLDDDVFRKEGLRGDRQRYQLVGEPAPTLRVDRTHGRFAGLESYRGKVLLLEFTAHWCHACHAALPSLKQLHAEMKDRGFEVVAVTTYYGFFSPDATRTRDMPRDEEFARMPAMLEKQGVSWPMVYTDRETLAAYGVTGIPQIMLLDKHGRIRKIDLGFSEAKMERFRKEIQTLLAE